LIGLTIEDEDNGGGIDSEGIELLLFSSFFIEEFLDLLCSVGRIFPFFNVDGTRCLSFLLDDDDGGGK